MRSPIIPLANTRAISCEKKEGAANTVMWGQVREDGEPFAIGGRFIQESGSIRQFGNTRKLGRAKECFDTSRQVDTYFSMRG